MGIAPSSASRIAARTLGLLAALACGGCSLLEPDAWYSPSDADRATLARLQSEADAANRRARLPFDSDRQQLAFMASTPGDLARLLTRHHGFPEAYLERSGDRAEPFESVRTIDGAACREVDGDPNLFPFGIHAIDISPAALARGEPCSLVVRQAPTRPLIRITKTMERLEVGTARLGRHVTTLSAPNGADVPLIHYGFRNDADGAVIAADIARALRRPGLPADPLSLAAVRTLIAERRGASTATHSAALAAFLADEPSVLPDAELLARSPAILAPHAPALVDALAREQGRAADRDGTRLTRAGDLVAALPDAAFRQQAPRLLAMLEAHPPQAGQISDPLVLRLADLGPAAIPAFAAMLRSYRQGGGVAGYTYYQAVCRIGAPAAPRLGPDLLHFWAKANAPLLRRGRPAASPLGRQVARHAREALDVRYPDYLSSHGVMLYVALKRLGLGEAADAAAFNVHHRRYRQRAAALGTGSPPDLCTSQTVD